MESLWSCYHRSYISDTAAGPLCITTCRFARVEGFKWMCVRVLCVFFFINTVEGTERRRIVPHHNGKGLWGWRMMSPSPLCHEMKSLLKTFTFLFTELIVISSVWPWNNNSRPVTTVNNHLLAVAYFTVLTAHTCLYLFSPLVGFNVCVCVCVWETLSYKFTGVLASVLWSSR